MTTTPTWDPFSRVDPTPAPAVPPPITVASATAPEPTPVFVDHSGRRGRRLRGLGWLVGAVSVGFAIAMIVGLIGTQSQAPTVRIPANVDTTPPGQYLDAPLPMKPPSPRAKHTRGAKASGTKARSTATATASAGATASATSTAALHH